jgi:hypothetical protein
MNMFMFDEALRPPRIGSLAIMSGTLLCAMAVAGPAFSADLPDDYYSSYRPRYDYGPSYYEREPERGCYRCGCCGGRRYSERPPVEYYVPERYVAVEERHPVERGPVAERHWVQRDYVERRYPLGSGERYSYPTRYRYSYFYPKPAGGDDPWSRSADPYSRFAGGEPPPRYTDYPPPAPVTYEWDGPRPRYVEAPRPYHEYRPAYEHEPPPPRAAYEYEVVPRPPVTVPSGYYYPGHAE